jgi:hypothetical protein
MRQKRSNGTLFFVRMHGKRLPQSLFFSKHAARFKIPEIFFLPAVARSEGALPIVRSECSDPPTAGYREWSCVALLSSQF